ncbi:MULTISPECIES: hypothetical protein [Klebsiella pneumoniae complex]|jgi:hypothetical protein|uniref:hypothetical protein n=1 Tax=Klebsiella pneumoniae complex TaxID=3390273 RepID=UPI000940ECAA|nr:MULTISPECIES: hypothetical protein [Klebsiella]HBS3678645.1 hypothetical protein [Klebsiella quasipneumoniae subsp. similipneumoniae]HEF4887624.1 hypothetical protein [Klebsiella oxytoca]ATR41265.1 hypothetical protein CTI63_07270 [Klebsiella pneumoniae]ATR46584.1 hypothetical protein CTI65_07270 [Klebsiella pneumoniae]AXO54195.1 hypothetical protein AXA58_05235 [Klebsiella pneumoniae]
MTHIQQLITAADSLIPFQSASTAKAFLNQYSIDDQAALISALYIGRDHLHANQIQSNYIPATIPFDRFFHTGGGHGVRWLIEPAEFATILYEKNTNLRTYYEAFERCANGSRINLSTF